MPFDRKWLQDEVAAYTHDRNLGARLDTFIDIATVKLCHVLESQENEVVITRTIAATPWEIEPDIVSIREVWYQADNGGYALTSQPTHQLQRYRSTGMPGIYTVKANYLHIRPFVAGNFDITYYTRFTIGPATTDTTPALEVYPFVFLDACLAECYDYKQDEELQARYENKWLSEVQQINRLAAKLRQGNAPAMRAV